MNWSEELAKKRSNGQPGLIIAWKGSLTRWNSLKLNKQHAQLIAESCETPGQLDLVTRAIQNNGEGETPRESTRLFLEIVDESPQPIKEWLEAIQTLYDYINRNSRRTTFGKALGFIHCCSDACLQDVQSSTLSQMTADMLEAYGFEG